MPPRLTAARRIGHCDSRRLLRVPVSINSWLQSSNVRRHQAELVDISVAGCRVRSPFDIQPGSALVIRVADLTPLLAIVRWCTASEIGLEFTRALDPRVVERISRHSSGSTVR